MSGDHCLRLGSWQTLNVEMWHDRALVGSGGY
jgi:hypothetical protein